MRASVVAQSAVMVYTNRALVQLQNDLRFCWLSSRWGRPHISILQIRSDFNSADQNICTIRRADSRWFVLPNTNASNNAPLTGCDKADWPCDASECKHAGKA